MNFFKRPRISLKACLVGIATITGVGLGAGYSLTHFVTRERPFCLSCHSHQSDTKVWRTSQVHPDIDCAECHAEPGTILPLNFAADSDRTNANCRRCHENAVRSVRLYYKFNIMKIKIPHKFHAVDMEIPCVRCHRNIFHDKTPEPTYRPRMDACAHCHAKETSSSCRNCHVRGTIRLPRSAHASKKDCEPCHADFSERRAAIYNVQFSHQPHLSINLNCDYCHSNSQKHGTITKDKEGCQACHDLENKQVSIVNERFGGEG
ncbi:MAG: cytochrome c3 family protein [Candidatus Binatia bacterium]